MPERHPWKAGCPCLLLYQSAIVFRGPGQREKNCEGLDGVRVYRFVVVPGQDRLWLPTQPYRCTRLENVEVLLDVALRQARLLGRVEDPVEAGQ